jgi:para-nitrobenzyl esterase
MRSILTLGLALTLPCFPAQTQPGPRASPPAGTVQGKRLNAVDAFLGVPYAAPPVGKMRWRAPAPLARWAGVRQATTIGPDCVQDSRNNPLPAGYDNRQSEDCLYLNVWRPAVRPGKPLPVMVWIHGGAFIMGSGSMPDYDGAFLARQGVIMVAINYRLGRFGTFAHPLLLREQAGEAVANYGLMDQIAALGWVRDNIGAFGGDPANVTIFGESAGASSVNFLMTSPAARGLFAKAISQSGGRNDVLDTLSDGDQSASAKGKNWADAKGAHDLATLRALSAEQVLDAPVIVPARPVIDGRIVVARTDIAFREGLAAPVPYLVGANDHEESLLRWFPGGGALLLRQLGPAAAPLLAAYHDPEESDAQRVGRLWGEASMVEPARWRAKQQAGHGQPVWLYRFAYVPDMARSTTPGVGHADEIPFVLGNPTGAGRMTWSRADWSMAQRVSTYWTAFAKTGDPNHDGAPHWPPFTSGADQLLLIDKRGGVAVRNFARDRLDLVEAAFEPGAGSNAH